MTDLPPSGKRMLLPGKNRFGARVRSAEHSAGLTLSILGFTAVSQPLGGPHSTSTCTNCCTAGMKLRRLMLPDAKSLVQLSNAPSCGQPPDNSTKQKRICEHGCAGSGGEGWWYTVSSYTTNYRHLRKTILVGF